ncbi:uncharacterized protein LOC116212019 [Punica granatum]|uniref:Uncharacterized protein LOC116212019 n=1 Tax=Punica granatum TaxID=22663 RepID=A0A218XMT7_PUNGR|nr:uncharacterized protein LOC116212019 [Punica granatum]OWM86224.1 hypothetical protein CDL15_Pgr011048 [Punica granatum]
MAVERPKLALNPPTICVLYLFLFLAPIDARKPHHISFRSPDLYPEAAVWDPSAQHFIVGSLRSRSIHSVSDAGVVDTLISDPSLPPNSTILGLAVDKHRRSLLAAVHAVDPLPEFNALAAYDLRSGTRLFLAPLPASGSPVRDVANDVTVDFNGNAYVTNSAADLIWKVTVDGEASIFSRSAAFTSFPVDRDAPYSYCGINGIAYVSRGFLLVVQSNTGKMYKVDVDDGTAKTVLLNRDLPLADGIAVRGDGVILVVSMNMLWFVKSDDNWLEGVVFDGTPLDAERFATSVAVGGGDRAYVLYGYVMEGIKGTRPEGREWFEIEEVRSEKESKEEKVWVYVLLGFGLAYFLFWRFQMKQLVQKINKKQN